MSVEEFLNHIKRFEEKEAYYEMLYKGFSSKLPPELTEIVFKHLPELNKHRKKYENVVFEIAEKYIGEIWEEYNMVNSLNSNKGPMANLSPVKKPKTREEAEKEFHKDKGAIPEKYHEAFKKVFWESYEEDLAGEVYEYAVYEKMKEVFTEFYIDDILEFDSNYLRYFDRGLYLMCSNKFVDEIYGLIET